MKNIKLTIAYDGTDYNGWQIQQNGITVQGLLIEKLQQLCKHEIQLNGAGRTDTGVHAKGQVANFFTDSNIPVEKFPMAIRGLLPDTIVVYKAEEVPKDFHARFSAAQKTYRYVIDNGAYPDIFKMRFAHHERRKLNVSAMHQAANYLLGYHDFTSFCAARGSSKTFDRTITKFNIDVKGQFIIIEVSADGFLYHMVRNLVGLLLEVGLGKLPPEQSQALIEAKDRKLAPATAPAKGLCLWEVEY